MALYFYLIIIKRQKDRYSNYSAPKTDKKTSLKVQFPYLFPADMVRLLSRIKIFI